MQELLRAARDGDTITLPAGTFTWTRPLNITKAITLEGQTTISGAGTANPVVKDLTIIRDDTPRSGANGYILKADMSSNPSGVFRLTGITFTGGTLTQKASGNGAIRLRSVASTPASMRLDHCHFTSTLHQGKFIWVNGWVYGVADHNVIEATGNLPFLIYHSTYGGTSQMHGNGAWADYPWYGTEKFFFIEDNTAIRTNSRVARGLVDSLEGGRFVVRHNYLQNMVIGSHGTEARPRGHRASEIYDNTFNYTLSGWRSGHRSGTNLFHDNVATGTGTPSSDHVICGLSNFRETAARPHPIWGIADGTSPWDVNDTEGNGTSVEGHPPFLFASGSATSGTTISGEQARFADSTKNWTPNQWIGYSIKNTDPASASYGRGSYIIWNDAHSISYAHTRADVGGGAQLIFNAGDTYQIHRVLVMMDQNGRGKGDQVTGTGKPINRGKGDKITRPRKPINRGKDDQITSTGKPINTRTGTPFWPHQALEPCYSWNNIYTPNGQVMGYGVRRGHPTTKLNIDFFNLGAGFPADSTPSQVSSKYTAALNGVDYVGTFVYPHPLVAAAPTPAPSATPSSQQHLQKKSKKAKKNKGKPQKNRRPT